MSRLKKYEVILVERDSGKIVRKLSLEPYDTLKEADGHIERVRRVYAGGPLDVCISEVKYEKQA